MQPLRSIRARIRSLGPARVDALIAAVFLAEGLLEAALFYGGARYAWIGVGATVLIAAGLAVRRRSPLAALALALAGFMAFQPLGREVNDNTYAPFFAVLFLLFSFGLFEPSGRACCWPASRSCSRATPSASRSTRTRAPSVDVFFGGFVIAGGPILLGRVIANRSRLNATLREKAEQLRRERTDQAEQAAAEERARIAGELHDVVAHAMSAMVVQAGGARRLAQKDPERARDAFAAVEETGREALTEIRRLLGVLRREDDEIALAPQPSLRHLTALVRRVEAAGLPVDLQVDGEERAAAARRRPDRLPARAGGARRRARAGRRRPRRGARALPARRRRPRGARRRHRRRRRPPAARRARAREPLRRPAARGPPPQRRARGAREAAGRERLVSRLWRRARMTSPLARDRVFAAVLFVVAQIEVLSVGHGDAPLAALMLAAARLHAPVRVPARAHARGRLRRGRQRRRRERAADGHHRYFVPFLGAMLFSYSARRLPRGPARVPRR